MIWDIPFKQRLFSWLDSYDIYDEAGNTVYVVKGQLSWGHKLVIYDAYGNEVGMVVQKVLTFLPKFEIYKNGSYIGCLSKEFSFLTPHYNIDYNGWHIDGTIMEWDYSILDRSGYSIARVSKELFHMMKKVSLMTTMRLMLLRILDSIMMSWKLWIRLKEEKCWKMQDWIWMSLIFETE